MGGRDRWAALTDRWVEETGGWHPRAAHHAIHQWWYGVTLCMATALIPLMELQFDTCSCTAVYGMYSHTGHILMFLRHYMHIDASPRREQDPMQLMQKQLCTPMHCTRNSHVHMRH